MPLPCFSPSIIKKQKQKKEKTKKEKKEKERERIEPKNKQKRKGKGYKAVVSSWSFSFENSRRFGCPVVKRP
jgi:hypothetical protein